jgi:hypothetical protein
MKFAMSLIALAGIATVANAATTLTWDVSTDGGLTWSSAVNANPGDSVQIRLRASLDYVPTQDEFGDWIPAARGENGFGGVNVLPRLSNFGAGDTVAAMAAEATPEGSGTNPFGTRIYGATNLSGPNSFFDPAFIGNATATNGYSAQNAFNGAGVPTSASPGGMLNQLPGGFGRQAPFGANGTNSNGVPVSAVESGELRWRAGVISNAGVSFVNLPSSQSSINAFVVVGQNTAATTDDRRSSGVRTVGGTFPAGRQDLGVDGFGLQNLVLFVYGITLSPSNNAERTLTQNSDSLIPAKWFTNAAGTTSVSDAAVTVPASITVIPTPGALALLGLGGLVATRRRR